MYELVNVFDILLPQLLQYPNPKDPLNSEAAHLLNSDVDRYNARVRMCVDQFAKGKAKEEPAKAEPPTRAGTALTHKESIASKDILAEDLSGLSELSDLSDTSNIMLEEEISWD